MVGYVNCIPIQDRHHEFIPSSASFVRQNTLRNGVKTLKEYFKYEKLLLATNLLDTHTKSWSYCTRNIFPPKYVQEDQSTNICPIRNVHQKMSRRICPPRGVQKDLSTKICPVGYVHQVMSRKICPPRYVQEDLSTKICSG